MMMRWRKDGFMPLLTASLKKGKTGLKSDFFSFPRSIVVSRLKNQVCPTIYNIALAKNSWIHAFTKDKF